MDAGSDEPGLAFGRWRLLPRARQLLADGAPVPLGSRALDLLLVLVEAGGALVSKDDLLRRVWPGTIVEENNLQVQVSALRKALGEEAGRLIATAPGRGYRFIGAAVPTSAAPSPGASAAAATPSAAPRPPTGRPMVVVLPFENIGADLEQGYFADGLTADLVTDLTRFQALHVVSPRRGVRRPEPALPETPSPGAGLPGAACYLVSGSVRRAGGRIRVVAQLEDAQSGVHLWAERLDRPFDDLFAVQEELADHIAARLITQMDHEGLRRAKRRPPASLDAYDLCLRGRELHGRGTAAATLLAREMFDRAIEADPDYAPALAWQAYTVQRAFTHGWGEPRGHDALRIALDLAGRAVEIEPDSSLCLARLAFILLLQGRYDDALETGRAAIRANPGVFESRLTHGEVVTHAGDPGDGVRELRLAISLDPFHPPSARAALGRALLLAGRPEEALPELRWCAARLPDYGPCLHSLVVAAAETGCTEEARAALRETVRLRPGWVPRNHDGLWFFRRTADVARFHAAFRTAGLPEG